jgi:streptomycin 6-kinase
MRYNISMKRTDHRRTVVVPERVRLRAEQSGPQSRQWLKDLPRLIAELEYAWELSIGPPLWGGSSAYVAPVQMASGTAVIKIDMPSPDRPGGFQQERDTLLRANGCGYVRILQFDNERRALLLEKLGRSMQESQLQPEQAITLLCKTLKQAWLVPAGMEQTLHPLEYKAQTLAQLIYDLWDRLARPCSENLVSQALEFARRRIDAFDPARCVVVHGDPHPANALLAGFSLTGVESDYVFVDPEGFFCEPEYDLGVIMRDWNEELLATADPLALAHSYCQLLARESGLDEAMIWEWGFIERVSSGLYLCAYSSNEHGQVFFKTAQHLLDT